MKKFITNKVTCYVLGILLVLLIWWIASITVDVNDMIVPTPINTFKQTGILLADLYTYKCIGFTLLRVLYSFIFSFIFALILGMLAGNSTIASNILKPGLLTIKSIPTAALVFLFAILVGSKNAPILVTIMVSFPILYEAVSNGISNIDKNITDAVRVDGTGFLKRNLKINLPVAFPYILVGIFSSFSLSFKVEIMAEVISGSTSYGLGSAIKASLNTDPTSMVNVFAYALITIIIVLIITLLAALVKNKFSNK